jgi:hypothetical protein
LELQRNIYLLSIKGKIFAMIYIQSRQSADLFNVAQFKAKELRFAGDSALVAHSAEEMQKIVGVFSDSFDLKIKIKKTEVL